MWLIMNDDCLYSEHDRFMSAKEAAERYAKRIEELQLEVSVFMFQNGR